MASAQLSFLLRRPDGENLQNFVLPVLAGLEGKHQAVNFVHIQCQSLQLRISHFLPVHDSLRQLEQFLLASIKCVLPFLRLCLPFLKLCLPFIEHLLPCIHLLQFLQYQIQLVHPPIRSLLIMEFA
ncbi:hypothetical protein D3C75_768710 [compost metagenome]